MKRKVDESWQDKYAEAMKKLQKQKVEYQRDLETTNSKFQEIVNQLNNQIVKLSKISNTSEAIQDLRVENAKLQLQMKELAKKYNDGENTEISICKDRISFYETFCQMVIISEKDMIYECVVTTEKAKLTFKISPALDEDENKIEYSLISFYIIKGDQMIEAVEQLPAYLKQKIKFQESLAPQFLIRIHKALEKFQ